MKTCEHGYPLSDIPNQLPHIRTRFRIEVCKECAIASALSQMGSGMVLDNKIVKKLKKLLKKV